MQDDDRSWSVGPAAGGNHTTGDKQGAVTHAGAAFADAFLQSWAHRGKGLSHSPSNESRTEVNGVQAIDDGVLTDADSPGTDYSDTVVASVEKTIIESIPDALEEFACLWRYGQWTAAREVFRDALEDHAQLFAVAAEFAEMLHSQGAFKELSEFTTKTLIAWMSIGAQGPKSDEVQLIRLYNALALVHTRGQLKAAVVEAQRAQSYWAWPHYKEIGEIGDVQLQIMSISQRILEYALRNSNLVDLSMVQPSLPREDMAAPKSLLDHVTGAIKHKRLHEARYMLSTCIRQIPISEIVDSLDKIVISMLDTLRTGNDCDLFIIAEMLRIVATACIESAANSDFDTLADVSESVMLCVQGIQQIVERIHVIGLMRPVRLEKLSLLARVDMALLSGSIAGEVEDGDLDTLHIDSHSPRNDYSMFWEMSWRILHVQGPDRLLQTLAKQLPQVIAATDNVAEACSLLNNVAKVLSTSDMSDQTRLAFLDLTIPLQDRVFALNADLVSPFRIPRLNLELRLAFEVITGHRASTQSVKSILQAFQGYSAILPERSDSTAFHVSHPASYAGTLRAQKRIEAAIDDQSSIERRYTLPDLQVVSVSEEDILPEVERERKVHRQRPEGLPSQSAARAGKELKHLDAARALALSHIRQSRRLGVRIQNPETDVHQMQQNAAPRESSRNPRTFALRENGTTQIKPRLKKGQVLTEAGRQAQSVENPTGVANGSRPTRVSYAAPTVESARESSSDSQASWRTLSDAQSVNDSGVVAFHDARAARPGKLSMARTGGRRQAEASSTRRARHKNNRYHSTRPRSVSPLLGSETAEDLERGRRAAKRVLERRLRRKSISLQVNTREDRGRRPVKSGSGSKYRPARDEKYTPDQEDSPYSPESDTNYQTEPRERRSSRPQVSEETFAYRRRSDDIRKRDKYRRDRFVLNPMYPTMQHPFPPPPNTMPPYPMQPDQYMHHYSYPYRPSYDPLSFPYDVHSYDPYIQTRGGPYYPQQAPNVAYSNPQPYVHYYSTDTYNAPGYYPPPGPYQAPGPTFSSTPHAGSVVNVDQNPSPVVVGSKRHGTGRDQRHQTSQQESSRKDRNYGESPWGDAQARARDKWSVPAQRSLQQSPYDAQPTVTDLIHNGDETSRRDPAPIRSRQRHWRGEDKSHNYGDSAPVVVSVPDVRRKTDPEKTMLSDNAATRQSLPLNRRNAGNKDDLVHVALQKPPSEIAYTRIRTIHSGSEAESESSSTSSAESAPWPRRGRDTTPEPEKGSDDEDQNGTDWVLERRERGQLASDVAASPEADPHTLLMSGQDGDGSEINSKGSNQPSVNKFGVGHKIQKDDTQADGISPAEKKPVPSSPDEKEDSGIDEELPPPLGQVDPVRASRQLDRPSVTQDSESPVDADSSYLMGPQCDKSVSKQLSHNGSRPQSSRNRRAKKSPPRARRALGRVPRSKVRAAQDLRTSPGGGSFHASKRRERRSKTSKKAKHNRHWDTNASRDRADSVGIVTDNSTHAGVSVPNTAGEVESVRDSATSALVVDDDDDDSAWRDISDASSDVGAEQSQASGQPATSSTRQRCISFRSFFRRFRLRRRHRSVAYADTDKDAGRSMGHDIVSDKSRVSSKSLIFQDTLTRRSTSDQGSTTSIDSQMVPLKAIPLCLRCQVSIERAVLSEGQQHKAPPRVITQAQVSLCRSCQWAIDFYGFWHKSSNPYRALSMPWPVVLPFHGHDPHLRPQEEKDEESVARSEQNKQENNQ
ncbi:hypothetical protein CAC42_5985 [Sphaceloma murrayae]|uniref:Uncharacterized protein n=1 Tax=Sphaceloma murrayae TaxID=2082308 RepID=A0A2K1QZR3_9PEZI|nr:hypothetical protein CAC42_5985 [Sphaceloma murrayae]